MLKILNTIVKAKEVAWWKTVDEDLCLILLSFE